MWQLWNNIHCKTLGTPSSDHQQTVVQLTQESLRPTAEVFFQPSIISSLQHHRSVCLSHVIVFQGRYVIWNITIAIESAVLYQLDHCNSLLNVIFSYLWRILVCLYADKWIEACVTWLALEVLKIAMLVHEDECYDDGKVLPRDAQSMARHYAHQLGFIQSVKCCSSVLVSPESCCYTTRWALNPLSLLCSLHWKLLKR